MSIPVISTRSPFMYPLDSYTPLMVRYVVKMPPRTRETLTFDLTFGDGVDPASQEVRVCKVGRGKKGELGQLPRPTSLPDGFFFFGSPPLIPRVISLRILKNYPRAEKRHYLILLGLFLSESEFLQVVKILPAIMPVIHQQYYKLLVGVTK